MDAGANIDRHYGVVSIGVPLAPERLDVAGAKLVGVVNNPGFPVSPFLDFQVRLRTDISSPLYTTICEHALACSTM
jgi:hypothetical protein